LVIAPSRRRELRFAIAMFTFSCCQAYEEEETTWDGVGTLTVVESPRSLQPTESTEAPGSIMYFSARKVPAGEPVKDGMHGLVGMVTDYAASPHGERMSMSLSSPSPTSLSPASPSPASDSPASLGPISLSPGGATIATESEPDLDWAPPEGIDETLHRERVWKLRCFLATSGFNGVNAPRMSGMFGLSRHVMYPLHAAVRADNAEIVAMLLWAGADRSKCDSRGLSPLDLARRRSSREGQVVQLLAD